MVEWQCHGTPQGEHTVVGLRLGLGTPYHSNGSTPINGNLSRQCCHETFSGISWHAMAARAEKTHDNIMKTNIAFGTDMALP